MSEPSSVQPVTNPTDIASRTVAFIQSLGFVCDPIAFELFFHYLIGGDDVLKRELDDAIAAGRIDRALIEEIHHHYFASDRRLAQLALAGQRLHAEADTVQATIGTAHRSAADYQLDLQDAAQQLIAEKAGPSLPDIIQGLLHSTEQIQQTNAKLQSQLHQSECQVHLLQESIETLRVESMSDPLTGLPNRRFLNFVVLDLLERAAKDGRTFCLVLVDVDYFKGVNDLHGHALGDDVLRLVAFTLHDNVRRTDTVARYGGDEFALLLPETTRESALQLCEKIRQRVTERPLCRRSTGESLGHVTISAGVAEHNTGQTPDALFERADANLYQAKANGRNRVVG